MTKILFNNQGAPLLAFGDRYFASTAGAPTKRPDVSKQLEKQDDKVNVDGQTIVSWGSSNDFPTKANELIRSVGVLNTGLKFIRNFTLGQGIFPCRVTGYDDLGNEQLQVLNDQKLINFCQGRMVRRYLEKAARDYLKYGKADVQLIPNMEGTEMAGINTLNTIFTRYSEAKNGIIEKCIVSGSWPDQPSSGEFESFDLLDEYDPFFDLESRRLTGRMKGKSVIYSIRDSWSNNDYYSEPIWYSAYLAGWVDVARLVPSFLKKAFQNQITWKWHVQIPYAFWDRKFPATEYRDITARQAAIEEYMDRVEENLCGSDNADKPIFTFFEINPHNGKAEEQWIIEALDNKYKENDKLITSAAANSEILFSLMLNPNVLGAGMPGGTYAGNQGGSNIREAFLVNVANAWLDRQNLLDPLELFLQFNGVKDVQIRFRNTILTTLDTGAGTTKKLS
ncbi:MAG: hypothetical protein AB9834_00335 [Lentimicrobium sp.]